MNSEVSDRSWVVTLLLAIFLPVHRFYVGKVGTGILYWLTVGGFGIWYIVDIVLILLDIFTDKEGRKLRK
ncbi:TM2 domain-containing protein [Brachyspira pilosicoli]|uniref:TM2 transmembrane domain 2 protein n=4 Tax=Brachyspira pilosicoli TaxID=52584 RepID=D8IA94_BRAP9|nr:TM2 domain-containing protein [Brachyspira pilosicoli]ADK32224.1 TM2 transmembrane domain 2 protein [Brachyspira pilosicoli 95/1000]AFR70512.1 TM2 domain-containing protein [Brachyspira pilosicoli B2904]AGA66013.1 TM2 transmembrane domain 2 protein [Brachyspira pilosicoli P43/6/78]MBW5378777.1 TM2 domain-containing protein [Brachyspira pilosicoli]MBW5381977.1 TM2 domain-containing protein [Brachyspira pilosicoli]